MLPNKDRKTDGRRHDKQCYSGRVFIYSLLYSDTHIDKIRMYNL